jgi:glycosyltransferase involved in cell wall biosynthesis
MNRVRVMQLVTGVAVGAEVGGAELFGIQLARYLDKLAFDTMVCGLWRYDSPREKEWIERLACEGIRVQLLAAPTGHLIPDIKRALAQFWREVGSFRPHVINSHSERCDVFNLLAHTLHPVHPRAVRTMQTDQQWQRRPWAGWLLLQGIFPLAFNAEVGTAGAICQILDARPIARLLRKKAVLRYSGIDAELLRRDRRTIEPVPGLPESRPRIGVVGRLSIQKGHSDLLEALAIVRQSRSVDLLIIGSGPLEGELRQTTAALGLQDCVHFLGSRNDVFDLLPQLDLIVLPSLWEGFPTVLLEAMALSVPVVATDVSGSRELVKTGKTGILVPPRAVLRLAEAISEQLSKPEEAQRMARTARQHVERFTVQIAAAECGDLYRSLLATQPR